MCNRLYNELLQQEILLHSSNISSHFDNNCNIQQKIMIIAHIELLFVQDEFDDDDKGIADDIFTSNWFH